MFLFYSFETLPYAIKKLQGAGYKLVTVAECLGKPAYQTVGKPSPRTVSIGLTHMLSIRSSVPI